jgi:methionine-rich copper-binding protein CopC
VTGEVVGRRVPSTSMRPSGPEPRRVVVRLVAAIATLVTVFLGMGTRPVGAHTDIDFTLPTDGAAVGEPVAEVTVGFTDPVTLIGPGFEVLDPQGTVLTPFVATDDDQVFRLQLDPPLAGGEAAVRYEVRAPDGHTVAGGFSFTISVDAGSTTTAVSTTTTVVPETTALPGTTESAVTAVPERTQPAAPAGDVPTTSAPAVEPETDEPENSAVYLTIAAAVVTGAAVFLFIRSRATTAG